MDTDLALLAIAAAALALLFLAGRRRATVLQEARVRWFRKPVNRPAVYLLRSRSNPHLFKVGYTARRVETRAAEIAVQHGDLEVVAFLRMPHAYAAEQDAHRRLSRAWGVTPQGGEWYVARGGKKKMLAAVLRSARRVRRTARLRGSWPKGARIALHDGDLLSRVARGRR